jgi:hypothetical protein
MDCHDHHSCVSEIVMIIVSHDRKFAVHIVRKHVKT